VFDGLYKLRLPVVAGAIAEEEALLARVAGQCVTDGLVNVTAQFRVWKDFLHELLPARASGLRINLATKCAGDVIIARILADGAGLQFDNGVPCAHKPRVIVEL
jgi:hypothetical protein